MPSRLTQGHYFADNNCFLFRCWTVEKTRLLSVWYGSVVLCGTVFALLTCNFSLACFLAPGNKRSRSAQAVQSIVDVRGFSSPGPATDAGHHDDDDVSDCPEARRRHFAATGVVFDDSDTSAFVIHRQWSP